MMMSQQSRTSLAAKNIFWGYVGNVSTMLISFATRTVFIYTIGITYLGINGLFTNVLGVLSFTELGIGTAMNFSLYKPVADNDREKIKALMQLYRNAYRVVALVVAVLGIVLLPFLPYIIKGANEIDNLQLYYLLFLFNTVSSYFVTYKYGLINAEQRGYILTNINSAFHIAILLAQIAVLLMFKNFLGYLLTQSAVQLIQKIVTAFYIDKKYPFLKDKNVRKLDSEETKKIKKNVNALIVHKIGDISVHQTDNIIISALINVTVVGLVSNYNLLVVTISTFLNIIFNSFTAGFGNLIATESKEKQLEMFTVYHFLGFWIFGFTTISFIVLIQPFITLWIGPDKLIDNFSMLLIMANHYLMGQRITVNNFKIAGGVFNEDKFISILQSVVNLIVSVTLVRFIGLPGIYIGTVLQGLISNLLRPAIVYRVLLASSAVGYYKDFVKHLAVTTLTAILMLYISSKVLKTVNLKSFVVMVALTAVIPNMVFTALFWRNSSFKIILQRIKSLVKGRARNAG